MFTADFNIFPDGSATPVEVSVNKEENAYFVSINGKYTGAMVADGTDSLQFSTEDEELEPYIGLITQHINADGARLNFPDTLSEVWGENISGSLFVNDNTLEVAVKPEVNLDEFAALIKDSVYDIVNFDEALDLILFKEDTAKAIKISINQ